ncbi:Probable RNA-directed DNA polymerase from transposon BS [Eumeta japonica]|uniref:Probable RNA-directed DNA polymerase from transposon BS n=1 Tax=Eumeta variegata TaxID=151549 RepID=A0A4C1U8V0_EUMVA|nr:Probable RNA-directed DNA polymerase from transposon BS [Eumeta japonica]
MDPITHKKQPILPIKLSFSFKNREANIAATKTLNAPNGVTNAAGAKAYANKLAASPTPTEIKLCDENKGMAIDDAEIAECLADSIETQCSHASSATSLISVASRKRFSKTSLEPKDDLAPVSLSEVQTLVKSLNTRRHRASMEAEVIGIHKPGKPRDLPASYRPISLLSDLGKLFEKILKTRLSDHLLGKGLIIDEQFGFRPAHSCPQQVLRLVKYVSEGFETERSTVAVFFDVAKAFDRVWHAANRHFTFRHERTHSTRRLIRAGVPQGSTLSPLLYSAYTNDIPRPSSSGVQLALFADDTALFYGNRIGAPDSPSFLQRAIDELGQWFQKWRIEVNPDKSAAIQFKTVMTYASPVFAHASKALHRLQVIQNKFCRAATDAHWCVRNSILHRDLELPTISKYMKDASKRFFDIAGSHPNALHARRLTVNRRIPPTLSVGYETYLPIHLTLLQRQLKANDVNDTHD